MYNSIMRLLWTMLLHITFPYLFAAAANESVCLRHIHSKDKEKNERKKINNEKKLGAVPIQSLLAEPDLKTRFRNEARFE